MGAHRNHSGWECLYPRGTVVSVRPIAPPTSDRVVSRSTYPLHSGRHYSVSSVRTSVFRTSDRPACETLRGTPAWMNDSVHFQLLFAPCPTFAKGRLAHSATITSSPSAAMRRIAWPRRYPTRSGENRVLALLVHLMLPVEPPGSSRSPETPSIRDREPFLGSPRLAPAAIVTPSRTSANEAAVAAGPRTPESRSATNWTTMRGPKVVVMPRSLFNSVFRSDARWALRLARAGRSHRSAPHKTTNLPPCGGRMLQA